MHARRWIALALAVTVVVVAGSAAAQGRERELARELARLMLDDTVRRSLDEQVGRGMLQAVAGPLQQRLDRRLLEVEWRMLADIIGRFLDETLPPTRTEEIAAEIYARHFDAAELAALVEFQRSAVGRKAARLTAAIAGDTRRAIEEELRTSPAMRDMVAELHRAFPVLGASESP
ncbi:MAG: DUF2059 domain-containing protein [Candidatus Rokubacteria bacterium]|nr:DUF2059 domain-containing protein [Candidatus Rokubacteria bacterium]